MENASKALIIAGAILLSILIISLGLVIYNQASSTINNVNLSEQEIQTFNSKFMSYVGNNMTAAQVNALLQQAIATNQSAINSENGQFIKIVDNAGAVMVSTKTDAANKTVLDTGTTRVSPKSSYKVEVTTYGTSGMISEMKVTAN